MFCVLCLLVEFNAFFSELHASIAWAQRKDQVFLSIDLQDVKDQKIDLQSDKLTFSGVSGGKKYVANVEFFKPIDTEVRTFPFCKSNQFYRRANMSSDQETSTLY